MLCPRLATHALQEHINVICASHKRFGYVTKAISSKIIHVAYTGMLKICAKRIQSVFNAPVTHVELIQTKTRQASKKYLSMFKTF